MRILIALKAGILEILSHKTRSVLSFLSIAVGAAAFLYTAALIYGWHVRMEKAFAISGYGRITIYPGSDDDQPQKEGEPRARLTYGDYKAVKENFPELPVISPTDYQWQYFIHGSFGRERRTSITGVTPDWAKRDWIYKLSGGRFFTWRDMDEKAKVCVVVIPGGWAGKKPSWWKYSRRWSKGIDDHLLHSELLGEKVMIGSSVYTVVGVLAEPPRNRDPRFMQMGSGRILVPLTACLTYLSSDPSEIGYLQIDTGSEKTIGVYKKRILDLLKSRHGAKASFKVDSYDEVNKQIKQRINKSVYTIFAIGLIAILSGGIGIMNVMLATIYSRIKEIGVRRALGASRSDILLQFVVEALILGFLGGLVGTAIGAVAVDYLSRNDEALRYASWFVYPSAIIAAEVTAFLFSVVPAWQASALDPVESLRYE